MKKEQRWKVVCQVCGRVLYNTQAKKRWDDLIVCPNDWEPKHPFLRTGHHYRHKGGGEGSLPYGAAHTGEPADTFVAVCDVYSSMGVVGYGTTGCARSGSYLLGLSPLPSANPALPPSASNPEIPIIVPPDGDAFWFNVHFVHNTQSVTDVTYGPYVPTANPWTLSGSNGLAFPTIGVTERSRFISNSNLATNYPVGMTLEGFTRLTSSDRWGVIMNDGLSWRFEITTTQFEVSWGGNVFNLTPPSGIFHYAFVDDAITLKLYINGVLITTTSGGFNGGSTSMAVGYTGGGGPSTISGLTGPIRLTIGTTRYTAAFTPPPFGPFPTSM